MMEFISLQFNTEGFLCAVIQGIMARFPDDMNFDEGRYQRVFMERGEGKAFINAGGCIPDHFTLLSVKKFSKLKSCAHEDVQQLLTEL